MVSEKLLSPKIRFLFLILSGSSFTGAGIFYNRNSYFVAAVFLVAGLLFYLLADRINSSINEAITVFFDSLRNDDTTIRFPENIKNKKLAWLYMSMNNLNSYFQEIRLKNESNEAYYRILIQNATAGLMVLGANNKIELINKTACNYAGISPESTNSELLKIKHPAFYEAVCNLKAGQNVTYKNLISGNLQLLSFRATIIRRKDENLKLVSIQDIRRELESRELESYRKLLNVMTHEIMNLLSPLTAVARELYGKLVKETTEEMLSADESLKMTTVTGLKLINEQSTGLINFMNNYRKLSRIPEPEFSYFPADEWVSQLNIAFSGRMKENNVNFRISVEKSLRDILADRKLLNQVMVNLINNALDAVMENEGARRIDIQMMKNEKTGVVIKVLNNGPIIPKELLEKIFVPFFTMKRNGSGVGLSISQEIMKMHNGSITAISSEGKETCFLVEF